MTASQHLLLTGLGVLRSRPDAVPYRLGDRVERARLSPSALYKLLDEDDKPERVLVLVTEQAERQSLPCLREELGAIVEPVHIPSGLQPEDIDRFLRELVKSVRPYGEPRLTLDLTQGPRHFALLLYAGALYLQSLRKASVGAAYYCFFEGPPGGQEERPFFDLRPLIAFPRWIHALETLVEARDAIPMARLLDQGEGRHIARQMRMVSEAFASGLPLEMGRMAAVMIQEKLRPMQRLLEKAHKLPLSAEIGRRLSEWLSEYTLAALPGDGSWKTHVRLDETELQRQARLIEALFELGNYRSALGLLDEWIVSWAICRSGQSEHWLDYEKVRRPVAQKLDALMRAEQDCHLREGLSQQQKELARFWAAVKGLRNGLAHHGMGRQLCLSEAPEFGSRLEEVRDYWRKFMQQLPEIPLEIGARQYGKLLVSPIGERPGVLFSAVRAARLDEGDAALAICSERSEPFVYQALERAGFRGFHAVLKLHDPYAGVAEFDDLIRHARPHLARAGSVLVNITGGTTLMGLLADKLASEAHALGLDVRRFGLIDRRPPDEQASDPYVEGQVLWLTG